ncbi:ABC transporter permease [Streptomyces sp. NPDC014894]|uniref:ABC transporter permease n=1 Tax=unclassified Streptomyces TaxID=2593676 RepID=UPI0036F5572F
MSATTTAAPPSSAAAPRRTALRGMTWVIWRSNRTVLLLLFALTAVFCAYALYDRAQLTDFLSGPGLGSAEELPNSRAEFIDNAVFFMNFLPILIGVFLGAPLLAGEEENGTLRLVTTQSVARTRITVETLALPLLSVLVCVGLMSAALTWLWHPVRHLHSGGNWWVSGILYTSGPVPVAFALLSAAAGIAAGALLRRSVPAMGLTFVFLAVSSMLLPMRLQRWLASPHTLSYPMEQDPPALERGAVEIDWGVSDADGKRYEAGACFFPSDEKSDACVAQRGIVNHVVDYLDYGQLHVIQWSISAILLAAAAALVAFAVWWTRRKSL